MAQERELGILSRPVNKGTAARMRFFLEVYVQTGRLAEAARIAGVNRKLHYRRIENDPVYKVAFELAEQRAVDALEDEAVCRAIDGVKRPVMHKGAPVKLGRRTLYITTYSDMLLLALLKRFRRSAASKFSTEPGAQSTLPNASRKAASA
jgi:hypothetical protein